MKKGWQKLWDQSNKNKKTFPFQPAADQENISAEPNNGVRMHTAQHNLFLWQNQTTLLPARNDEMKEKLNAGFQAIVTAEENDHIKPG